MTSPALHMTTYDEALQCRRLSPLPTPRDLDEFYREEYYEAIAGQEANDVQRAPDLLRLADDDASAAEREWLGATLYTDILHYLSPVRAGARLLDIGAGTGDLLAFMEAKGFDCSGTEPSATAVAICESRGLAVDSRDLSAVVAQHSGQLDVVSMMNVLEHVLVPADYVDAARALLRPNGLLVVQVPNDFSVLQEVTEVFTAKKAWWIANPDHVNYWNLAGFAAFIESLGFEVLHRYGTFPMEMLALAGVNYVDDGELGAQAHRQRKAIELGLEDQQRRNMAESFAAGGLGRNTLLVARPVAR